MFEPTVLSKKKKRRRVLFCLFFVFCFFLLSIFLRNRSLSNAMRFCSKTKKQQQQQQQQWNAKLEREIWILIKITHSCKDFALPLAKLNRLQLKMVPSLWYARFENAGDIQNVKILYFVLHFVTLTRIQLHNPMSTNNRKIIQFIYWYYKQVKTPMRRAYFTFIKSAITLKHRKINTGIFMLL